MIKHIVNVMMEINNVIPAVAYISLARIVFGKTEAVFLKIFIIVLLWTGTINRRNLLDAIISILN